MRYIINNTRSIVMMLFIITFVFIQCLITIPSTIAIAANEEKEKLAIVTNEEKRGLDTTIGFNLSIDNFDSIIGLDLFESMTTDLKMGFFTNFDREKTQLLRPKLFFLWINDVVISNTAFAKLHHETEINIHRGKNGGWSIDSFIQHKTVFGARLSTENILLDSIYADIGWSNVLNFEQSADQEKAGTFGLTFHIGTKFNNTISSDYGNFMYDLGFNVYVPILNVLNESVYTSAGASETKKKSEDKNRDFDHAECLSLDLKYDIKDFLGHFLFGINFKAKSFLETAYKNLVASSINDTFMPMEGFYSNDAAEGVNGDNSFMSSMQAGVELGYLFYDAYLAKLFAKVGNNYEQRLFYDATGTNMLKMNSCIGVVFGVNTINGSKFEFSYALPIVKNGTMQFTEAFGLGLSQFSISFIPNFQI